MMETLTDGHAVVRHGDSPRQAHSPRTRFRKARRVCFGVSSCALLVAAGVSVACGESTTSTPLEGSVEDGEQIYAENRCANCHGMDALGLSVFPFGPRIVGRQAEDLEITLVDDCEELVATDCHPTSVQLAEQGLQDLEAYLRSLLREGDLDPGPVCDDQPGNICTIAGNGLGGNERQPGLLAREQRLFWPQNISLDPQGRVVIVDWNNYLGRRIENEGCRQIEDEDGNSGEDCPIVNIVGTGIIGDDCSTPGNPVQAVNANMNHFTGLVYDDLMPGRNNLILWGWHQYKIKYIEVDDDGNTGNIHCLFGNGLGGTPDGLPAGFNLDGEGGPTRFDLPSSAVYDDAGNFYISDQGNLRIRRIAADDDDESDDVEAFVESRANNVVTTIAGLQDAADNPRRTLDDYSDSGDGGPAAEATFNVESAFHALPELRLAIDRERNLLYVGDAGNHRIRVIDLNEDPPTIDTFAGGGEDVEGDGIDALDVELNRPLDVDVVPDGSGDVVITDTVNNCIRLVDFETREVRTLAGVCGVDNIGYEGDGNLATEAILNQPGGAYMSAEGILYIADTENHRVRRVNP